MPDLNGPGREPQEKRRFIREKIVKQPPSKRQIAARAAAFFFVAVVFGIVAAVSFVVSRPMAEKYLYPEPTMESQSISIPKDEPEMETEMETETETETEPETEPIEDILQSAMEKYEYTVDDLNSMYAGMRSVAQTADKGIVTVHSVQQNVDWFDNPVQTTGLYAGAVIASTDQELLVLVPEGAVESADSIRVTFADGYETAGQIRQSDTISKMAVVAVSTEDIPDATLNQTTPLVLGNSYTQKQGDLVVTLGCPSGQVHSLDYGFISYVARNVQLTDGNGRLFYTDAKGNAGMGTFLINMSGEVIGWATDAYSSEKSDMTIAMAISDYKGILERLTNGKPAPYFGVLGQEISSTMTEQGMPEGVYVVSSITGSPSYNAGIQNGDIITKVGSEDIRTMKDFQTAIEKFNQDQIVKVMVERRGREEYTEIEYQVTIGTR